MENGEKPAYPTDTLDEEGYIGNIFSGLNKRENFAAMAMQGLLSNPNTTEVNSITISQCVEISDALLKALEQ